MSISTITPTQPYGSIGGTSAIQNSMPSIDGSDFMKLMLAQMRHQNPLEPMDDKEMISQMAQLNSLSELQQINGTLQAVLQALQPSTEEGGAG